MEKILQRPTLKINQKNVSTDIKILESQDQFANESLDFIFKIQRLYFSIYGMNFKVVLSNLIIWCLGARLSMWGRVKFLRLQS